ncbi:MAG: outer membrane protein assembly factor BamA [Bacteroidota bacterium]
MKKVLWIAYIFLGLVSPAFTQVTNLSNFEIDYSVPREYEIGGITISGVQYLDNNTLISLSGLKVGDKIKIPGEKITRAIQIFWEQGLFSDVKITATKLIGTTIFLDIYLKERPKLSRISIIGLRKAEANKIKEKITLTKGDAITSNRLMMSKNIILEHFVDKGYLNTEVNIVQKTDSAYANYANLDITVNKHSKVKIQTIHIEGNTHYSDKQIARFLKETKRKRTFGILKASKYSEEDYKADKNKVIEKYNLAGFRDAVLTKDSLVKVDDRYIDLYLTIAEGKKYYFRSISWVGNTKHTTQELTEILKIKRGDIYNQSLLNENLTMNKDGRDVSSLYMDDGYLFFSINPVETQIDNDSIDIEIRISEGKQATINRISITGNLKTSDRVILREIRTKPGQLFNRSDIQRSVRQLAQLRFFDPEKINISPTPNPSNGTVDLEYTVEETSSDQVEMSGGWGAGRVIGTLGLSFNNFSARKTFKKGAWKPLPSGDGQMLSIRAQSNGLYYQSYNASFTEPWLGGKKPNALSVTLFHTFLNSNGRKRTDSLRQAMSINGVVVGLGRRMQWPDDFFTFYTDATLQNYTLDNYSLISGFSNGVANNVSLGVAIGRNSIDAPIYARAGSEFSLKASFTPPYSVFNSKDYSTLSSQEKYHWVEYHKWKFKASWFTRLAGNLVLNTRMQYGFLGMYNPEVGLAPFERFYVGGDGLTGYNSFDGRELIALRGYENQTITPRGPTGSYIGASIFDKYTAELRFPVSLNPMATIFVLGFVEAGNSWLKFKDFNPFSMKRSAGVGVRIYLPFFGMLGLDWGYGFDKGPYSNSISGGQFHFSIGTSIE